MTFKRVTKMLTATRGYKTEKRLNIIFLCLSSLVIFRIHLTSEISDFDFFRQARCLYIKCCIFLLSYAL